MISSDDPTTHHLDDLQDALDDADPAAAPDIAEELAGELGEILDGDTGDDDPPTEPAS